MRSQEFILGDAMMGCKLVSKSVAEALALAFWLERHDRNPTGGSREFIPCDMLGQKGKNTRNAKRATHNAA